jgi:signal transduction histidine kinase
MKERALMPNPNESFVSLVVSILQNNEEEILTNWLTYAHVNIDDPFYYEIIKNGRNMIKLVSNYLQDPDLASVTKLTDKVAQERVEADVNIGDFVHNIHIGRKVIINTFQESNLSKEYQVEAILALNTIFDFFVNEAVTKYTLIKDEIIKNKTLFIQEMHNDRLTILGQVAASFAHEFRNPLTSIKGFINLLEDNLDGDEQTNHYFSIINNEMDSLQTKVNQFLYLSKMKILDDEMESFSLSKVIKEMVEFLSPRFNEENIHVSTNIINEINLYGVKDQVKQVLLNILHNAIEELHDRKENRLIEITLQQLGSSSELVISNNGPQIPTHLLENIFQPFISTKNLGTGLGLSVCRQILEKHNSSIRVESNEENTSFILTFPLE